MSSDPFARTRQPVPDVPQFRNGKPTEAAAETEKADAAPAPAAAAPRKVVEYTLRGPAKPVNLAASNIVDVQIDMSEADKGFGWSFTIDKARAARIADQAITAQLEAADNDNGTPVIVGVKFGMLYLAGGAGALLGSPNSAARVSYDVRDRKNHLVAFGSGRANAAGSRRLGGLIGAAQVKSQDEEMALVSQAVAAELKKAIFAQ